MNPTRIKEIRTIAVATLGDAYGSLDKVHAPIDLNKVADSLGLEIKQGEFKEKNVLGAFDRKASAIYISENDFYPRKAFTTAHEIGHFQLHADIEDETFYRTDMILGNKKDEKEKEADCFAANLLMPDFLVKNAWSVERNVSNLAKHFGVSLSAMNYRLKNLGLIN